MVPSRASRGARGACPPAVNDFLIDPFCARFSRPDQHHPCSDSQRRVRDPTKAKMRRFFAKKGSGAYPNIKPAVPPARVILVRLLAHATVSDRHLPFQSSRSRQSYRVVGGGADPVDGPLRPTARLSAIGTFARSTRARQANRFAERPEFCDQYARATGARLKLCQAQAVGRSRQKVTVYQSFHFLSNH